MKSPPARALVLYTPPGEPFFCAEPVSNITDAFYRIERDVVGTGCMVLAPGEIRRQAFRPTPSETIG